MYKLRCEHSSSEVQDCGSTILSVLTYFRPHFYPSLCLIFTVVLIFIYYIVSSSYQFFLLIVRARWQRPMLEVDAYDST